MKKITTLLASTALAASLFTGTTPSAQAAPATQPTVTLQAQADVPVTARKRCKRVTNQYAPYDEFTIYASGSRYNGKNTWRTAIIASYKSCPRRVFGGRIGVEFRHISGKDVGSDKCRSIRDFTANLSVYGFNPGPATTDCNNQDSRFISWVPTKRWVLRKGMNDGFKDVDGSWDVDIAGQRDRHGDYSRLYPRFGG